MRITLTFIYIYESIYKMIVSLKTLSLVDKYGQISCVIHASFMPILRYRWEDALVHFSAMIFSVETRRWGQIFRG